MTPCRLCSNLPGCPHLTGRGGQFLQEAVIDEDNPRVCKDYGPMGEKEGVAREGLHRMLGTGYIRGLHVLPRASLVDIKEEDDKMDEVPDLASLITEGMKVEDRLEQLQYVTEDDGSFAQDDNGNLIPRGQLPVRKYASDQEGPLAQLEMPELDTVEFLDFEKVLDLIIKAEKKLYGLDGKKPSKTKKKAAKKAAKSEPKKKENTKMPVAKPRIMLRKTVGAKKAAKTKTAKSNGAADKTPNKVKAKVSKAATSKKTPTKKAQVTEPASNGEATGVDLSAVEAIVEAKVAEATKDINGKLDAVLEAVLEAVGVGPNGRSVSQTVTDGVTALHDAMQQKISNVYFNTMKALSEEGPDMDEEGNIVFSFLDADDGRDCVQNLLEGEEPMDVISFYLDAAEEDEGEDEGEEDEE